MICLEFSLNGEEKIVAGDANAGVVTAMTIAYPKTRECGVTLFGEVLPQGQPVANASWFNRTLKVGDVVTIRVVESDHPAAPKISRSDPVAGKSGILDRQQDQMLDSSDDA